MFPLLEAALATVIFVLKVFVCVTGLFCTSIVVGCKWLKIKYFRKVASEIRPIKASGRFKDKKLQTVTKKTATSKSFVYDVVIVGGGPGGSCCGYYCAQAGLAVALLERKSFPRDKICGDAINVPAIRILKDMGVMQELIDNNEVQFSDSGGFVSPSGLSYIGKSVLEVGEPLAGAVRRTILDERVAKMAEKKGMDLFEGCEVDTATFDQSQGLWTIRTGSGDESFHCRVLISSDGAQSSLGRKIGIVTEPPKGVSTRAYITGGTHNANLDGICFYPPHSLPGYCAVFRHVDDDLSFCYYLTPCGKEGKLGDSLESDLPSLHKYALEKDPFVHRLVGPKAKIEPMKVAPLRVNCQGVKATYDEHLLLVGDAAGFVDPVTGEGIHNALMSGRDAAMTLKGAFSEGDFSKESLRQYEDRWMKSFGFDLQMSTDAVWLLWKCPILIDAVCYYMQQHGDQAFADWARVMTMMEGKEYFLQPRVAFGIIRAFMGLVFNKYILSHFSSDYVYNYNSTWKRPTTIAACS